MTLFACTRDARLVALRREGDGWSAEVALDGIEAQCVAAAGRRVLVGTRGRGLLASADGGATWDAVELPEADVASVAFGPGGARYAGTEPSRVFVARDGGGFAELDALQDIPSRPTWSFPPRPWTHHVRWIAPDPHRSERVLVGIELGGLMLTEDGGASFADRPPTAKRDIHAIAWHPAAEGRAYHTAGDGAAWSDDGGRTWRSADAGRDLRYCWALAVDPADPGRWYVSAASGPMSAHRGLDARGRLYRRDGEAWTALALPGPESMPYGLAVADGALVAGMADGRMLVSDDRGDTWADAGVRVGSVVALVADG